MDRVLHSVTLQKEHCNGCTNCLSRCPTQAIRIVKGKATIIENRCIDCGECIRVCPHHAKKASVENLSILSRYKYRVAIPAISIYGQFGTDVDMNLVFGAIKQLGFDEVYDMAHAADLMSIYQKQIIMNENSKKPLISTFCPAITRIIQSRFPALIKNIIKLELPAEIAARSIRNRLISQGMQDEEIGIIYISACPAMVTSIRNPVGVYKSSIDEIIATEEVYYKVMKIIGEIIQEEQLQKGSGKGILWATVGGQSHSMGLEDYIAVDGIEEVIKVLESMEIGKLNTLDFFEGYACVNGCVGGPLNVENTFIAKNKITKSSKKIWNKDIDIDIELTSENFELHEEIVAAPIFKLDSDFTKALEKMKRIEEIVSNLPGINCGACGAPSCRVMAEDVVQGRLSIGDCRFLNCRLE